MATIINNPSENSGLGVGMILGIVVAVVVMALLLVYGFSIYRGGQQLKASNPVIKVELPVPPSPQPQPYPSNP